MGVHAAAPEAGVAIAQQSSHIVNDARMHHLVEKPCPRVRKQLVDLGEAMFHHGAMAIHYSIKSPLRATMWCHGLWPGLQQLRPHSISGISIHPHLQSLESIGPLLCHFTLVIEIHVMDSALFRTNKMAHHAVSYTHLRAHET